MAGGVNLKRMVARLATTSGTVLSTRGRLRQRRPCAPIPIAVVGPGSADLSPDAISLTQCVGRHNS